MELPLTAPEKMVVQKLIDHVRGTYLEEILKDSKADLGGVMMKVRTVLGGIALFGLGVAVGMHGRDMLADTSHHIYHSHGGHGGSSRFKPFEDIDDLPL